MTICLAVDIGGTKIAAALIEMYSAAKSNIVARHLIETRSSGDPLLLTAALAELLGPLAASADYVAVASTGIIDNGVLTALNPQNLGGLDHFPLHNVIAQITDLPVYLINDAQAAAWAEYLAYRQEFADLAFITVSTGVGAGLILNHKLITGSRGVAGHAGHMLVDPQGPQCGCGRRGCVEVIASGRAIAAAGQAVFGGTCSGMQVYQLYLQGDARAQAIIRRSADAVAELIANLTITLDLDAIVIGGGVGLAENYIGLVKQALVKMPDVYRPQVLPARCDIDAGLLGVAQWVAKIDGQGKNNFSL
ncbi:N-acetylmannosamine kinase [Aeromonas hydrophila]|uniref:N-acetylmannosamine kinase n=1 Tax=Aeromonas TaxID=642 RepID=UPI000542C851|nr:MULTISPECIES: N-acetylmannosamine kinase [Aeromonas]HDT5895374.1 N-acetylmannosamine kinase [Aeromonas hydrophila subsp. hydrophila]KHE13151.1 N-acetylmannosamine kinase [Aeromonas hydrophila]KWR68076.1 N-acetylmannosamine kinase [Aeromonas hydrophila]MBC6487210.1 N-acetylmannosamine kinase [Aeromonas hydrophila]MBW3830973.1 ROK family protein [Aeromonas hydrophila]